MGLEGIVGRHATPFLIAVRLGQGEVPGLARAQSRTMAVIRAALIIDAVVNRGAVTMACRVHARLHGLFQDSSGTRQRLASC
jgi:hypothetical protein